MLTMMTRVVAKLATAPTIEHVRIAVLPRNDVVAIDQVLSNQNLTRSKVDLQVDTPPPKLQVSFCTFVPAASSVRRLDTTTGLQSQFNITSIA